MSQITSQEAVDIAHTFLTASNKLGEYRFANWQTLSATERQEMENAEWTLMNYSSDLVTKAVGIALDEAESSLEALLKLTTKAGKAIKNIAEAKKIIGITTALIGLGAALATQNPGAIASALGALVTAVK